MNISYLGASQCLRSPEKPTGIHRQWNEGCTNPSTREEWTSTAFRDCLAQFFFYFTDRKFRASSWFKHFSKITESIGGLEPYVLAPRCVASKLILSALLLPILGLSCEGPASPSLCSQRVSTSSDRREALVEDCRAGEREKQRPCYHYPWAVRPWYGISPLPLRLMVKQIKTQPSHQGWKTSVL